MTQATAVTIDRRFNGPLDSGNGGYSSGVFAGLAAAAGGAATVTLRRPVPLETPLDVLEVDGELRILDGEALIAEARPEPLFDIDVPAPVSVEVAAGASTRFRGVHDNVFSRCFVCGRARASSFEVFAGRVEGRHVVATTWTPPAWTADANGRVRDEFVWAALDCPTYYALHTEGELPLSFLGRMTARVDGDVVAGEEHVVMAWPLEAEGRKRYAGCAVLDRDGEVLAVARALIIEPRAQ